MSISLLVQEVIVRRNGHAPGGAVLNGVSMTLKRGEWIDIEGASGCGKSTLLETIAGFLPMDSGSLTLEGIPIAAISPPEWRTQVALVQQRPTPLPGTVRDNLLAGYRLAVRTGSAVIGDETLSDELESAGLGAIELDRTIEELSVGELARVALLRLLILAPKVILLDEPSANLDEASSEQLSQRLARYCAQGGAVVRVRHHAADQCADRLLRLDGGILREVTS